METSAGLFLCGWFWQRKKPYANGVRLFGAPAGTRILDPLIKSQMLYQLSYGHLSAALYSFNIIANERKIVNYNLRRTAVCRKIDSHVTVRYNEA